jgi:hypothetical protein
MQFRPVSSSIIHSIGHDGLKMHVQFLNGAIYEYKTAPVKLYRALLAADSVGQHFNKNVRGRYPHTLIRPAGGGVAPEPVLQREREREEVPEEVVSTPEQFQREYDEKFNKLPPDVTGETAARPDDEQP